MYRNTVTALILAVLLNAPVMANELDPMLADYSKVSNVSGNIISVGSDTLANLMTLWAEIQASLSERHYPGSGGRLINRSTCANSGYCEFWADES